MSAQAPTPNPSPVRPDLDRIEKRLNSIDPWEPGWDFVGMIEEDKTFAGYACRDIAALVAYARRLEAEVAALRGVVKDGFAEGFNAGVGIGEDWTRPNVKRAREEAWENSDAREAATPGEEGRKE